MTMTNPILKEIHEIRKQILDEHGDDLGTYLHFELERAKASGHPVAKIKQRTIRGTGAVQSGELAVKSQESTVAGR